MEKNLKRLEESELPWNFVVANKSTWDHAKWLEFVEDIKNKGFDPIDLNAVGMVLERLKLEYRNKTKMIK